MRSVVHKISELAAPAATAFPLSSHLPVRGLKMNIPLDARTPSYDDTGDSALSLR